MTDNPQQRAVTLVPQGRHCKRALLPGTNYCWQHQREPEPTEEDRLLVLRTLAAPGAWSLEPYEIGKRIPVTPAGDGRTREHRLWVLRTLTLEHAVLDPYEQGLVFEAVPADGDHSCEMRITDAGREYLAFSELVWVCSRSSIVRGGPGPLKRA